MSKGFLAKRFLSGINPERPSARGTGAHNDTAVGEYGAEVTLICLGIGQTSSSGRLHM